MGGERGVSQDFPDEHYWRIIDWIIFGFEPLPVLKYPLAYESLFFEFPEKDSFLNERTK